MSIEVTDRTTGVIHEFPDGTSPDVIKVVMTRARSGGASSSSQPEGFLPTLSSEFQSGINDIFQAVRPNPGMPTGPTLFGPVGGIVSGAARAVGSPFTALGRKIGQKVQDVTLPYLGVDISSGLATAADLGTQVFSPNAVGKAFSALKSIPQFGKAAKITELSKPLAVPPPPDLLMAESELGKATGQTADAMKGLLATERAPIPVPPELSMAESLTGQSTEATRAAVQQTLANQSRAASLAGQARAAIPTEQQALNIASDISPIQKSTVEAGKFGIQSFEKQKAIAEQPFKQFYSRLENTYAGQRFEPKNALAAKQQISGIAEPLEQGIALRSERIAGQEIGTEGVAKIPFRQMSDEQVSSAVSTMLKNKARLPPGQDPVRNNAAIEKALMGGVETSSTMSMRDLILARRRMGAAARGAWDAGDGAMANEFQSLKSAYHADIAAVNPKLANKLAEVDKQYATEFIPKYGFDSVANKAVNAAGEGEGLLPGIFKPASARAKDDLMTIKMAKSAFAPEDFGVLSRSFVDGLIQRSKVSGDFNAGKLRSLIQQYRPETLIEGLGQHGYDNLKQFANEMNTAERLQGSAQLAQKAAVKSNVASKATFKNEQVAMDRYLELSKEREGTIQASLKAATEKAKKAFDLEGDAGSNYQRLEKARAKLEENLNSERLSNLKKIQDSATRASLVKGFEHVGRWSGPFTLVYSAMHGNVPGMATGIGMSILGPTIADLIVSDRSGKIIRGLGSAVPGSIKASAKAAQINAFLSAGKKPESNLELPVLPQ